MTLTEIQTAALGPVRMLAVIHEPREIMTGGSKMTVVDCPAYAWNESDKPAVLDLANTFGEDLVDQYETSLHEAAYRLIEPLLEAAWGNRDFAVAFVYSTSAFESGATPGPDGTLYAVPADEIYWQVWQAAADAITDKDLVHEAALGHIFQMSTDVERHRAALHHRLDAIAATFDADTSDRAWQQLDGWRGAVDSAVARPQLIQLSAQICS